jgi:hypothetical protein
MLPAREATVSLPSLGHYRISGRQGFYYFARKMHRYSSCMSENITETVNEADAIQRYYGLSSLADHEDCRSLSPSVK